MYTMYSSSLQEYAPFPRAIGHLAPQQGGADVHDVQQQPHPGDRICPLSSRDRSPLQEYAPFPCAIGPYYYRHMPPSLAR
eukprot:851-Prorocentrum_minimum.AAC.1